MAMIHPVILCGGSGTRLWRLSRKAHPKRFLPLVGEETLFEAAVARVADAATFAAPMVVAGSVHGDLIEAQLGDDRRAAGDRAGGAQHRPRERARRSLASSRSGYAPQSEHTLAWDDPAVGIEWPVDGLDPLISEKDARGLALADVPVFV